MCNEGFFLISLRNKKSTSITISADGAWQKRGSGRVYDSLTGKCEIYFYFIIGNVS